MPYQVTSIRDNFLYTAIVPRRDLAYTIIKYLAEKGLSLDEFKQVVLSAGLSEAHIMDETEYYKLVDRHPEMDLIYEAICLKNNQRMYFHTNWTVAYNCWQAITETLAKHQIQVTTLKQTDLPNHYKSKTPVN